MNIYDVAEYAGVSVATVSRVINNTDKVRDKTRKKVEKAIKDLNYFPNDVARALASSKTNYIGIMVGNIRNYFDNQSAYQLERNLKDHEIVSILCNTSDYDEEKIDYLKVLREKKVDGIITVGSTYGEKDFLQTVKDLDIPAVMINVLDDIESDKLAYVCCDEVDAMEKSLEFFKKKGYKKPLLISRDKGYQTRASISKQAGFIKGLKKYFPDVDLLEVNVKDVESEVDDVIDLMKKENIDIIQFEVDKLALKFYKEFYKRGIRIPEDVAMCGFDNEDSTNFTNKRISSIDQRIDMQAKIAVDTLLDMSLGEDFDKVSMVKAQLVQKETI